MPVNAQAIDIKTIKTAFVFLIVIFFSLLPGRSFSDEIYQVSQAASAGDLNKVKTLVEHDPALVNIRIQSGWTPLHYASRYERVNVAEYLILHGADVNARTDDNQTPLSLSVKRGGPDNYLFDINIPRRKKMIDLLIANGAKTNEIDEAIAQDSAEIFDAILKNKSDSMYFVYRYNDSLRTAAFWGSSRVITYLLKRRGELVSTSVDLEEPLLTAAMMGYKEIVVMLVYCGADVNSHDNKNFTPLYKAVMCGNGKLFFSFYDPRDEKYFVFSPSVDYCKPEDYIEIVKLLIAAGADVNTQPDCSSSYPKRSQKGAFPLQIAVIKGWTEMAELLLSAGARSIINEKDYIWHYTSLHHAAEQGNKALVKVLLDNGADTNIKDDLGKTPLKIAEEKDHKEIVDLLRERGAEEHIYRDK